MNEEAQSKRTPIPGLLDPEHGEQMHPLLKKLLDNIKPIAIVFVALVVIFGGYALYDYYQTSQVASSSQELGTIVAEKQGEELVKALRGFVADAPGPVLESGLFELAGALEKEKKYDEALEVWTRLQDKAADAMKPVAELGYAENLLLAGKAPDAVVFLEKVKAKAPESYAPSYIKLLAECAEQAQQYDKALTAYKELTAVDGVDERTLDYLQYKIAQLETKAGKNG